MKKQPIVVAQIMGKWVGGGVEAVIMNYYRNIDRSKIQFDFICDEDSTNIPYEEIKSLGGGVILIPPYQKVFKYHKELKRVIKQGNYKIIHSHINTLSVFSLFAAKCAEVPIRIAHSHATTNKKEFKRNIIKCILRPLNMIYASNYACCSDDAGKWMFGNNKVKKINNAIELKMFSFDNKIREEYREKLKIQKNQIVIGHVGRMVETKNHSFLIKIFSKICEENDAILLLIGQGPLEEKLKKQVELFGLQSKVFFLGQKKDINNWYQTFDAFVLPSLYEGFGMALLEAQVSNIPCIVSNNVPKEAKLINDVVFLSLNDSANLWSRKVIELANKNKRKSNEKLISSCGYEIKTESIKLEKWYQELYDKWKCKNEEN